MNDGVGAWHALPVLRKQGLFPHNQVLSEMIAFGRDISLPYRGAALSAMPRVGSAVPQIEGFNADGTPGRETRPLQNETETSALTETSVRQPPVTACAVPAPFKGGNFFRTAAPIRRGGYQPPAAPPIPHRTADGNAAPPTKSVGEAFRLPQHHRSRTAPPTKPPHHRKPP